MTDKEIFELALIIMHRLLETAAQCDAYIKHEFSGWTDTFCREEIHRSFNGFGYFDVKEEYHDQAFWDRVMKLPNEKREILGFHYYSKETAPKMLIPLWVVRAFPKGVQVSATCINGQPATISKEFGDLDTRGGCIAYMI